MTAQHVLNTEDESAKIPLAPSLLPTFASNQDNKRPLSVTSDNSSTSDVFEFDGTSISAPGYKEKGKLIAKPPKLKKPKIENSQKDVKTSLAVEIITHLQEIS